MQPHVANLLKSHSQIKLGSALIGAGYMQPRYYTLVAVLPYHLPNNFRGQASSPKRLMRAYPADLREATQLQPPPSHRDQLARRRSHPIVRTHLARSLSKETRKR